MVEPLAPLPLLPSMFLLDDILKAKMLTKQSSRTYKCSEKNCMHSACSNFLHGACSSFERISTFFE